MEREQIFLLMEIAILEITLSVKQMAKVFINGLMGKNMKENILMIKNTDLGNIIGQRIFFMKGIG